MTNPTEIIEVTEDQVAILNVTYSNSTIDQFRIKTFHAMPGQIVFTTEENLLKGLSLNFVTTWAIDVNEIKINLL